MMQQLMEKNLLNTTKAAMGSEMERPIGSKAAKKAAAMRGIDIDIDPDGDISNMKVSDGSLMSAMNEVKTGSE